MAARLRPSTTVCRVRAPREESPQSSVAVCGRLCDKASVKASTRAIRHQPFSWRMARSGISRAPTPTPMPHATAIPARVVAGRHTRSACGRPGQRGAKRLPRLLQICCALVDSQGSPYGEFLWPGEVGDAARMKREHARASACANKRPKGAVERDFIPFSPLLEASTSATRGCGAR